MHAVVALALPAVEAFDLAIPAQVFADPGLPRRYEFTVCAPAAGQRGPADGRGAAPRRRAGPVARASGARAETGMAPMHWLTAARIREARRLLEATDLSVEVIAEHRPAAGPQPGVRR